MKVFGKALKMMAWDHNLPVGLRYGRLIIIIINVVTTTTTTTTTRIQDS
jgi:hypothetical protein